MALSPLRRTCSGSAIIVTSMPSPVGHVLAGIAVALVGNRQPDAFSFRAFLRYPPTLWAVALAALPDADLLLTGFHRTATHSLLATLVVTIVAMAVTGQVTRAGRGDRGWKLGGSKDPPYILGTRGLGLGASRSGIGRVAWNVVLLCAAAHASHLLLDWLGGDRSQPAGIQLLWPWSDRWFISGWDIFPQVERRRILSAASVAVNLNALVWELLLMGAIVLVSYGWRATQEKPRRHEDHEANKL